MTISTSVVCSMYPLKLIESKLTVNSPGAHWIKLKYHVMGLLDFRARSGEFSTPWNAVSIYKQPLPDLTIPEHRSLKEIMDFRAQEIYNNAIKSNKKIMVMWSGGIDSTSVLVALLKTIPVSEYRDMLTICMTSDSLLENFYFYKNFISVFNIPIIHKLSTNFSNSFLNEYILLHGDPGDALFGSGSRKFQSLIEDKRYLLPYKDNMNLLYGLGGAFTDSWKFLVDKITNNLEHTNLDQIVSIADWFWWQYINFKWEGSLWRPFCGVSFRKDHSIPIGKENILDYLNNTFFNTAYFQRWSYTNIHNFYPNGISGHKHEIKNYIFDFDKNLAFKENKTKMESISMDLVNGVDQNLWKCPAYYDENWVGYMLTDSNIHDNVVTLLHDYKG